MKLDIKHMVLGPIQTNVYFVSNPETKECVIIDPADNAPRIDLAVRKLGVTPVAILLTHGHFDHITAADEVRKMYGIKIYALDKEEETLKDPYLNGDARFYRRRLTLEADVLFHDGDELEFLGEKWKVIWTPGHTAGSCCFYIEAEKVLFSGDTLFQASYGRYDMPGGCFSDLQVSLKEKLFSLPDDVVAFPGHMEETTIGFEKRYNPIL